MTIVSSDDACVLVLSIESNINRYNGSEGDEPAGSIFFASLRADNQDFILRLPIEALDGSIRLSCLDFTKFASWSDNIYFVETEVVDGEPEVVFVLMMYGNVALLSFVGAEVDCDFVPIRA